MSESPHPASRAPCRLLVLDIDGTLTSPDGRLSEKNASAVRRLQYGGTPVTLATGRSDASTLPIARTLGIHTPIITFNGGRIVTPRSRTVWMERRIPWGDALGVCRAFQAVEPEAALFVYTGEAILALTGPGSGDGFLLRQDSGMLLEMPAVRHLERYAASRQREAPLKMMIGGAPPVLQQLTAVKDRAIGAGLTVVQSEPDCAEILPVGSNKGSALKWLAGRLRIPTDEIVAVGNAPNDVDMLQLAGTGIAVADAHPDAIRAADFVAPASAEDAVADVAERLRVKGGGVRTARRAEGAEDGDARAGPVRRTTSPR